MKRGERNEGLNSGRGPAAGPGGNRCREQAAGSRACRFPGRPGRGRGPSGWSRCRSRRGSLQLVASECSKADKSRSRTCPCDSPGFRMLATLAQMEGLTIMRFVARSVCVVIMNSMAQIDNKPYERLLYPVRVIP